MQSLKHISKSSLSFTVTQVTAKCFVAFVPGLHQLEEVELAVARMRTVLIWVQFEKSVSAKRCNFQVL